MFLLCSNKPGSSSSALYRFLHWLLEAGGGGLEDAQIGAGEALDRAGLRRLNLKSAVAADAQSSRPGRVVKDCEELAGGLRAETDIPIARRHQPHGDHSE